MASELIKEVKPIPATAFLDNSWLGPAGWATFLNATTFDANKYSSVQIMLSATALLGGSRPTLGFVIVAMDGPEVSPTATAGQRFSIVPTIPATGGMLDAIWGTPPVAEEGMALNQVVCRSPHRLRYFRFGLTNFGVPTGISNGRLFIWGVL